MTNKQKHKVQSLSMWEEDKDFQKWIMDFNIEIIGLDAVGKNGRFYLGDIYELLSKTKQERNDYWLDQLQKLIEIIKQMFNPN